MSRENDKACRTTLLAQELFAQHKCNHDFANNSIFDDFLLVVLLLVFVVVWPFMAISGWWKNRRFWMKLHCGDKVVEWNKVPVQLRHGQKVLIVEWWPKGPNLGWMIDSSRDEIDPEQVMPTLHQFEDNPRVLFNSDESVQDKMNQWANNRLVACQQTACAVRVNRDDLVKLEPDIKRRSVIVMSFETEGLLSDRIMG